MVNRDNEDINRIFKEDACTASNSHLVGSHEKQTIPVAFANVGYQME